ncbi:LysR family transcriptional regulator [Pacificimonas flava]|uniref:Transcriptional regulator, LysR family n=1 Tax=Pacificimonas flava TaxID=1234595 RepID=M2T7Y4_9SPHN|nr:LysR family transcriptional regulator [Pacificimonas flava]EMD82639.1 Transcriptional regulator, LysR family [Pacificimonas flava]MBB5281464.1 DNA-binding transcriptional LysR family regulator [Pacificimonas flava]
MSAFDWDRLRLFHATAEAGSFTEAARRLGTSQPALSRQIASLEDALGAKLFHRHARGLALTHEGEQLEAAAAETWDRIERTRQSIEQSLGRPTGEIRITTTVSFGSTWLARALPDFMAQYPDIGVNLLLSDEDLDLARREAEVAIRFAAPAQQGLISKRLEAVRYRLCAAPAYLEREGMPESAADLSRHRLVAFGEPAPGPIQGVNWILEVGNTGAPRVPCLTVNSIYGLAQAVENGAGIAALPSYLIRAAQGRLQTILPNELGPVSRMYFVYPEELRGSIRVNVLRDFLEARMKSDPLDLEAHEVPVDRGIGRVAASGR